MRKELVAFMYFGTDVKYLEKEEIKEWAHKVYKKNETKNIVIRSVDEAKLYYELDYKDSGRFEGDSLDFFIECILVYYPADIINYMTYRDRCSIYKCLPDGFDHLDPRPVYILRMHAKEDISQCVHKSLKLSAWYLVFMPPERIISRISHYQAKFGKLPKNVYEKCIKYSLERRERIHYVDISTLDELGLLDKDVILKLYVTEDDVIKYSGRFKKFYSVSFSTPAMMKRIFDLIDEIMMFNILPSFKERQAWSLRVNEPIDYATREFMKIIADNEKKVTLMAASLSESMITEPIEIYGAYRDEMKSYINSCQSRILMDPNMISFAAHVDWNFNHAELFDNISWPHFKKINEYKEFSRRDRPRNSQVHSMILLKELGHFACRYRVRKDKKIMNRILNEPSFKGQVLLHEVLDAPEIDSLFGSFVVLPHDLWKLKDGNFTDVIVIC